MMATFSFQDIPVPSTATTATIAEIKINALNNIKAITDDPKPNYSIEGQSISWGDYLAQLQKLVEWCNTQLAVDEPFEVMSRGYSPNEFA